MSAALRYLASSVRGLTELELLDLLSCNDDMLTAVMTYDVTDDSKVLQSRQTCRFPYQLWYDIRHELGMQIMPYGVFTRSSKRPANFQQMYSKYTC